MGGELYPSTISFVFDSISPGIDFVKVHSEASETAVRIATSKMPTAMPKIIIPSGLS